MDKGRNSNRSITGRGAASNPKNRFERIELQPDPEAADPPGTLYLRDATRSIITTNDSPDVGFDASINPYRGCSHGCVYCMAGETPVLLADGTTRPLAEVGVGDEIYGTERRGSYRRYVKTEVLAHWSTVKSAYRITLADGTTLVAGADHRFLTERGWKFVTGVMQGKDQRPYLTPNNVLMGTGSFSAPPVEDREYRLGYLSGLVRGDGHIGTYSYPRTGRLSRSVVHRFRLVLSDDEALLRASRYLLEFGVATQRFVFRGAVVGGRGLDAIRASSRGSVDRVRKVISWPAAPSESWRRGFLAGIFDAEGSHGYNNLRISNTESGIIERIEESLESFGFGFSREVAERERPVKVVRITGGLGEHLRFFHTTDPAIRRKRDISGTAIKSLAELRVREIEPLGEMKLFDITTGTGDFIADGVVSHNCFARPTHEYLGLSAGLDFESRILVKEAAPQLLRRELASPRWEPRTLALSVATDPYQPVEQRLGLTRRCLEVLAEFRNPVVVITKNHLVTRDIDLLSELARHGAGAGMLSLTTLDDELRRVMEPRTSSPRRRLAAIRKLSEAGIPVGVMVAPVIPGLTDHELPELLLAAAEAGASWAGYTPVRLPHAVAPLFEDWLERNYPAAKEKILGRIRSLRGGRLNDPRFGSRMRGEGVYAEHLRQLFDLSRRRAGLGERGGSWLSTTAFRDPDEPPTLF